jgi:biopolymer transport protein ExbD
MKIPLQADDDTSFEMAPMIDMVFLLLVFFMCASHLSTMQNRELEIPTATRAVVPRERPDRFVINIDRDGLYYGGKDEMTLSELQDAVSALRETDAELKVYLRADRETPHKYVRSVMRTMAQAGVDDFIFGAFKPDKAQ